MDCSQARGLDRDLLVQRNDANRQACQESTSGLGVLGALLARIDQHLGERRGGENELVTPLTTFSECPQ